MENEYAAWPFSWPRWARRGSWVLGSALALVALGLAAQSCRERLESGARRESVAASSGSRVTTARAELRGAKGSAVQGTVTFTLEGKNMLVTARVSGLSPGSHGFHIHQRGVCRPPDFASAGDHFNPEGHPHGAPGEKTHAGDLGNLKVGADGTAVYSATLSADRVSLEPGPRSLLDRAVVVHEKRDDLQTQPTGGSGARVACGVIRPVL